ncbi:MAG: 2OG-Fe(II) oxygenase [Myxococcota bacterium]
MRRLKVVDGFAPQARRLRAHFDARFAQPRRATGDRFVWDPWHVDGQYSLLRTPAWRYFPRGLYEAFHQRLVWWGRRTLGCHDVSPPWLSVYVDGCEQRLHGDLPHGPLAFVFSLTDWARRTFRGGETLILRDEVLDYWRDFTSSRAMEEGELFEVVEPRFNRLVVFDPRLPHGVRRVEGSREPREGRVVIHGWFVQPRPFIEGPLAPRALERAIDGLSDFLSEALARGFPVAGLLSLGFTVSPAGRVRQVKVLTDTTRAAGEAETERTRLIRSVTRQIAGWAFPKQRRASRVTLPLVFER